MTYLENFELKNPSGNLSWCKPFADKNEDAFLIMYEGTAECVRTSEGALLHRYNGTLNDYTIAEFARSVNNGYYCYHGWTDENIALDVMHETGCASCPFRHECEAVNTEMEE